MKCGDDSLVASMSSEDHLMHQVIIYNHSFLSEIKITALLTKNLRTTQSFNYKERKAKNHVLVSTEL